MVLKDFLRKSSSKNKFYALLLKAQMSEMLVGKKYNIKHRLYGDVILTIKVLRKGENHEGYKFYQVDIINSPIENVDNWMYFEDIIEANIISRK